MEDIPEKKDTKAHGKGVRQLQEILAKYDFPSHPEIPSNAVKCAFYTPDIVTRVNSKLIPIDYINSKGQVAFDIGGLCLLRGKDIVDFSIAVISDSLWDKYLRDFRLAKLNLPPKITMIPMREVDEYFSKLS